MSIIILNEHNSSLFTQIFSNLLFIFIESFFFDYMFFYRISKTYKEIRAHQLTYKQ